jgi:hypothetical protein
MTVTGHVPNGLTIQQAVDAGMDQIAHLAIRGEAGDAEVASTIALLKERKTVMDPTQSWNELLGHAVGTPIAAFQPESRRFRRRSTACSRTPAPRASTRRPRGRASSAACGS